MSFELPPSVRHSLTFFFFCGLFTLSFATFPEKEILDYIPSTQFKLRYLRFSSTVSSLATQAQGHVSLTFSGIKIRIRTQHCTLVSPIKPIEYGSRRIRPRIVILRNRNLSMVHGTVLVEAHHCSPGTVPQTASSHRVASYLADKMPYLAEVQSTALEYSTAQQSGVGGIGT